MDPAGRYTIHQHRDGSVELTIHNWADDAAHDEGIAVVRTHYAGYVVHDWYGNGMQETFLFAPENWEAPDA